MKYGKILTAAIIGIILFSASLTVLPFQKAPPKIGIFYYVWYNPDWVFSWNRTEVVDEPVLGYYNSSDLATIETHLGQMQEMGIDFVIISWWGFHDSYGQFSDFSAKQIFKVAEQSKSTMKFALMVEPFNNTIHPTYEYAEIYEHVYTEFVLSHPSLYYTVTKPMIFFYNNETLTINGSIPHKDDRFNSIVVGQSDYAEWVYTDLNCHDAPKLVPNTNQVSVSPRYDDYRLQRDKTSTVDPDLTDGTYEREWTNATRLWKEGKINTIVISTWNEFKERTQIEPNYDATASNKDPYLLFKQTKTLISQLKSNK